MYSQERSMIINHRWKESRRLWTVGEVQHLENLLWGKSPGSLSLIPDSSHASVNITTNQALGYFCGPIPLFRHLEFFHEAQEPFSQTWHLNMIMRTLCISSQKVQQGIGTSNSFHVWKVDCSSNTHLHHIFIFSTEKNQSFASARGLII